MDTCGFCSWLISLKTLTLSSLEARAGNLGPSTIAWSSYSVVMVSISSYENDMGKRHPKFQCQSPSRSWSYQ